MASSFTFNPIGTFINGNACPVGKSYITGTPKLPKYSLIINARILDDYVNFRQTGL